MAAGHVFVAHADLRRLASDAWLLPCDASCRPEPDWLEDLDEDPAWPEPPPGWSEEGARTARVAGWPASRSPAWLTHVGSTHHDIGWYVEGARQFLDGAARVLEKRAPRNGRARHLVALPIVGTGRGGAKSRAGQVVRALLPALRDAAERFGYDVALVAKEEIAFAAARAERGVLAASDPRFGWPALDEPLRRAGERLADLAARGALVLFIGAGVSRAAGLPGWDELLDRLAKDAPISDEERKGLGRLDPLDRARFIEERLGGGRVLAERVAEAMSAREHALVGAQLAALPVREAVTTNYDRLFERASEGIGRPPAILPYASAAGAGRWLLKLHGTVERPDDIVLTREDFLRYAERRAALAGIVQALLITRHMLFVGFSLTDENFHRIADAVRRALSRPVAPPSERFGTALVLRHDPLAWELWRRDLEWVATGSESIRGAEAARRLEILLDFTLARTPVAAHLLDARFDEVLTAGDRALKTAIERFEAALDDEARSSSAWTEVEELLRRLGRR